MALPFTKDQVAEIIASVGADNLTAKKVRELLEQKLDMDSGELKQYKSEISEMIDTVMKVARGHCCPLLRAAPRNGMRRYKLASRLRLASCCCAAVQESGDGDEDEDEEEEEEEEEQPKKKAKKEPTADNPNKGKMSCATKSGDECPKVRQRRAAAEPAALPEMPRGLASSHLVRRCARAPVGLLRTSRRSRRK